MISLLLISCDPAASEDSKSDLFKGIYEKYGVKVHYKYSSDFFPAEWLEAPISAYGTQISPFDAEYMVDKIDDFLSHYSGVLINENLTDIYLFKELSLYSKMYGGTYRYTTLYIPNNGYSHALYSNLIKERLHSEFSSILYYSHLDLFPAEDWQNLLPEGFEYSGTGIEMLGEKNLLGQTEELLKDGFLVKYSTSSMENDLNMLVSWMFSRNQELQELAEKYPLIKARYDLVAAFYEEIGSGVQFRK